MAKRIVAEGRCVTSSGVVGYWTLVDDETTITDPEGVKRCEEEMKRVAARIFVNAELREMQNAAAAPQGGT